MFKPWFFGVSIVSDTVFNYIVKFKQKSTNIFKSILEIIIYLILIFACFIFNEQIICNSCGLNKNCEEEIIMRSNVEFKTLLIEEVSESEESFSN